MNILELINLAQEVGKSKVSFNNDFRFNDKNPREFPPEYFLNLKTKYDNKLHTQLRHKPKQNFFDRLTGIIDKSITANKKSSEKRREIYVFVEFKKELAPTSKETVKEISAILDAQRAFLNIMRRDIGVFAELSDFTIDGDFLSEPPPL